MAHAELSCQEIVELVSDHLDGALPRGLRERVEEHLGLCPMCLTYLDQVRATVEATHRLREQELDPAMRDELVRAFRSRPAAD